MKCQIPEISWHNRDPVLSVDVQPHSPGDFYRLASGGTDSHVLIWYMTQSAECGTISLDVVADLARHQRAVNAVRWSPNGELLASGDDESVIFIWKQKGDSEVVNILDATNDQDKETWLTMKILRGHMEDVYDLAWSPNSMYLFSGSVDNTAMVWDVNKGKSLHIFSDHKGFVQGVAWDPKNQYLATLSTDRYFRVFDLHTKKVLSRNNKCVLPVPKDSPLHGKTIRMYHDDTLQTFFRRLSFSPDGNLIITPSGIAEIEGVPKPLNTTYIYTRNSFKQPAITLPSPDQYTVAVRFCPQYFKLRPHSENKPPVIPLPYRMIFAVATKCSVYLYDTQQKSPFALISNIHYTRLTDLSWSGDGKILIVSSTDGFCSMLSFNDGELGELYEMEAEDIVGTEKEKTPTKKATSTRKKSKDGRDDEKEKAKDVKKLDTVLEESKKDDKPAQPIAFRRKSKEESKPIQKEDDKEEKTANPIAIKRKPKAIEDTKIGDGDTAKEKVVENSKEQKPAQPIAFRRKPKDDVKPTTESAPMKGEKSPQPIAIKRKPKSPDDKIDEEKGTKEDETRKRPRSDSFDADVDSTEVKQAAVRHIALEASDPNSEVIIKDITPKPAFSDEKIVQPAKEIIIEKEKIICSDEKFDSPSRKNRPVTPIAVRRHPRTPEVTPSSSVSEASDRDGTPKTGSKKVATPIAIRRQPRSLACETSNSRPKPSLEEDAVDTWPIDQPKPVAKAVINNSSMGECEQTEDFKLVISDDEEPPTAPSVIEIKDSDSNGGADSETDKTDDKDRGQSVIATTPKTPRRVEFRTLSTPKSKKKLL